MSTGLLVSGLEARLADATRRQDFVAAARIKDEIPAARSAWMSADARANALAEVLARVEQELAQRAAEEAEEQRRADARAQIEKALQVEHEGMAELRRHLADVEPQLMASARACRRR